MKKLTLLFIKLVFIFSMSTAQVIDTLPVNKAEFMPALKDKFEATNRSDLKYLFKEFDNQIKSGELSDKVLDNFIWLSYTFTLIWKANQNRFKIWEMLPGQFFK